MRWGAEWDEKLTCLHAQSEGPYCSREKHRSPLSATTSSSSSIKKDLIRRLQLTLCCLQWDFWDLGQERWKKRGRDLEGAGGVQCMSEGGQGEINICVASVHLPGVPKWFPGCKTLRIPNSKKSERRVDKKRGGTLLSLSVSWWPRGQKFEEKGSKTNWKAERSSMWTNIGGKDSQWSLSVSFDLQLFYSPFSLLGLSALLDSNLLSTPVIVNNARLEWGLSGQQSPTCTGTTE